MTDRDEVTRSMRRQVENHGLRVVAVRKCRHCGSVRHPSAAHETQAAALDAAKAAARAGRHSESEMFIDVARKLLASR